MKILYVEDNDDNVYMLKNRLSRAGYNKQTIAAGIMAVSVEGGMFLLHGNRAIVLS